MTAHGAVNAAILFHHFYQLDLQASQQFLICMNKVIDNGVLLLQCIITKIVVKEETQQVRHYHICSKCGKTEEDKGCTGKKCCFLISRKSISQSEEDGSLQLTNWLGVIGPQQFHFTALLLCRNTFVPTNLVVAIPAAASMI